MTTRITQAAESDANIELMHAVLDGQADAGQIAALDALLASDAAAAEQFAAWKKMFRSLSAVPMEHPPEGLVAAISASIPAAPQPARKNNSRTSQLVSGSSVIVSRPAQTTRLASGFRAFFHRSNRPESSKEFGQMNASRKIWAGGAVAVLALGVVFFATGYPPKTEDLTGTVVPADRYRATSTAGDVVKPGDAPAVTSIATPPAALDAANADAAKADAARMALKTDAQMQADKADASRMVQKTDAQLQAEKADASRMVMKTDAQLQAEKADAARMAAKTDAQLQAERIRADRNMAGSQAEKADAARMAAKTDAQLQAERADASRMLAKTDAQLQAERTRADKTAAQLQAEKADAARIAQKSQAQMQAEKADASRTAKNADAEARTSR
jgi:anti-sigma factor RsiW